MFSIFFSYVTGCIGDLALLFAVFSVWYVTNLFAQTLACKNCHNKNYSEVVNFNKRNQSVQWTTIYETYKYIRYICNLLNQAYGDMLTLFLADCISFFSANLDILIITIESLKRFRLYMFVAGTLITFVLAADTCKKVTYAT